MDFDIHPVQQAETVLKHVEFGHFGAHDVNHPADEIGKVSRIDARGHRRRVEQDDFEQRRDFVEELAHLVR